MTLGKRWCTQCGKLFRKTTRNGKKCEECKTKNIKEGLQKAYETRKKRNDM